MTVSPMANAGISGSDAAQVFQKCVDADPELMFGERPDLHVP